MMSQPAAATFFDVTLDGNIYDARDLLDAIGAMRASIEESRTNGTSPNIFDDKHRGRVFRIRALDGSRLRYIGRDPDNLTAEPLPPMLTAWIGADHYDMSLVGAEHDDPHFVLADPQSAMVRFLDTLEAALRQALIAPSAQPRPDSRAIAIGAAYHCEYHLTESLPRETGFGKSDLFCSVTGVTPLSGELIEFYHENAFGKTNIKTRRDTAYGIPGCCTLQIEETVQGAGGRHRQVMVEPLSIEANLDELGPTEILASLRAFEPCAQPSSLG